MGHPTPPPVGMRGLALYSLAMTTVGLSLWAPGVLGKRNQPMDLCWLASADDTSVRRRWAHVSGPRPSPAKLLIVITMPRVACSTKQAEFGFLLAQIPSATSCFTSLLQVLADKMEAAPTNGGAEADSSKPATGSC